MFPNGPPVQYWPGPATVNFGVRKRSGVFGAVWPLAFIMPIAILLVRDRCYFWGTPTLKPLMVASADKRGTGRHPVYSTGPSRALVYTILLVTALAQITADRNSAVGDPRRSPLGRYRPQSAVSCSTLRERAAWSSPNASQVSCHSIIIDLFTKNVKYYRHYPHYKYHVFWRNNSSHGPLSRQALLQFLGESPIKNCKKGPETNLTGIGVVFN